MAGDTPKARTQSAGKVLYRGIAHKRVISKEDWNAVSVDGPTIEWSINNLYMVPVEELKAFLDDDQFHAYIEEDPDFSIVGADTDKLPPSHPASKRAPVTEPYTEGLPGT